MCGISPRKEAMKVKKEWISLYIEQLKIFYETIPKAQRKEEMKLLSPMVEDKLLMRTGVEKDILDMVWGILKLEDDSEYKDMKKDFD